MKAIVVRYHAQKQGKRASLTVFCGNSKMKIDKPFQLEGISMCKFACDALCKKMDIKRNKYLCETYGNSPVPKYWMSEKVWGELPNGDMVFLFADKNKKNLNKIKIDGKMDSNHKLTMVQKSSLIEWMGEINCLFFNHPRSKNIMEKFEIFRESLKE